MKFNFEQPASDNYKPEEVGFGTVYSRIKQLYEGQMSWESPKNLRGLDKFSFIKIAPEGLSKSVFIIKPLAKGSDFEVKLDELYDSGPGRKDYQSVEAPREFSEDQVDELAEYVQELVSRLHDEEQES